MIYSFFGYISCKKFLGYMKILYPVKEHSAMILNLYSNQIKFHNNNITLKKFKKFITRNILVFSVRVCTGFRDRFFDCRDVSYYRAKRFGRGSFISKGIFYEFQSYISIFL